MNSLPKSPKVDYQHLNLLRVWRKVECKAQKSHASTSTKGYYAFASLPAGGSYTLTATKSDPLNTYTSTPTNRSFSNLSANQTAANFTLTSSTAVTLYPVADAYVQDGAAAGANFGAVTPLRLQTNNTTGAGKNSDVYLKFDLSGVSRSISSVKLRCYAAVSASGSIVTAAYSVANTGWLESGAGSLTWNNKPARGSSALVNATATVTSTTYATYELDVTNYVKGEQAAGRSIVSLALHNSAASTLSILLNAREAAANKPYLFITTGGSDNAAPTVNLTAPANGASYTAPATVTLNASAGDSDGQISKVDFYAGTVPIGTATASPYSITWPNVAVGSYTLTAVATDNGGATATSSMVSINVSALNAPPAVSLTTPLGGTTFGAGANISLSATAGDGDGLVNKVEFFAGATLVGTAPAPAPGGTYSVTWSNAPAGAYALTAKATDNAGAATTSSAVNINVVGQTGLTPTADAYVRDGTNGGTNFGTAAELQAQLSATAGSNREAYLKFDTTSVSGVTSAKVRLYGRLSDTSGSNVPVAIYSVASTSWAETTVKWSAKLLSGTTPLGTVTVPNNGAQWYEWDVTAYVQAEKSAGRSVVSFAVKSTQQSSPYATFNAREAGSNQPQLLLRTTAARTALLVTAATTLSTSESALKTRLQNLGFTVTVVAGKTATAASANGMAVVVISATVLPTDVNTKFRNVPVPVVNWESDILDDLGMTGPVVGTDFGTAASQTNLTIVNAAHPLAAGLSGTVAVVTAASSFTWGKPNANASKIATLTTDASKVVLFGYDRDVPMPGLDAPARRVGLFLSDTTAASLNASGNALFDAAVKWATETTTGPVINSLTPTSGPVETVVTISGLNFGSTQGPSTLTCNGVAATPTSWSDKSIMAAVPAYATTGVVVVTVNGVASNGVTFAVGDTDADGDGLPDWWELQYFGNLNQGASNDADSDGLTNLQEYQQGRNPTKSALADTGDFVHLQVHTPLRP